MAATGGIYLKYGSHRHAVGECSLAEHRETVLSDEKVALYIRVRWDIAGMLVRDTPAEISSAIRTLTQAYSNWGRDIGFYFSGGSATAHTMRNSATLDGIRVVQDPFFPQGDGAEYSTHRNYSIGIEWEEAVNPKSGLLYSTQEIVVEGNGGAAWEFQTPVDGTPESWPKTRRTPVRVTQSGTAVGFGGFIPTPADPLWSSEPPLHGDSVRITRRRPRGIEKLREVNWFYFFEFPSRPNVALP